MACKKDAVTPTFHFGQSVVINGSNEGIDNLDVEGKYTGGEFDKFGTEF